jgi:hypothetical protein
MASIQHPRHGPSKGFLAADNTHSLSQVISSPVMERVADDRVPPTLVEKKEDLIHFF